MFEKSKPAFRGWAHPGPVPPANVELDVGESLDHIGGHWCIFQYKKGHRFSTDDVLCAWYGSQWAPRVETYCDLGSGIGSVAFFVAWRLPGADVVTLEAQERSFRLQEKSIRYNGVEERFTQVLGDLREPEKLLKKAPFDLVTGSPPYWDEGDALASAYAQAVSARLEIRGGIAEYAKTAAAILAPGGVFATVFPDVQDERVQDALVAAGLKLIRSRAVRFKEGVDSTVSGLRLYLAGRAHDLPDDFVTFVEPPLTIRCENGKVHPEYSAIKLSFGFPPG
ncbi:MAG: methyltransferase [Deltaproteobacteria bacterium]|nr:methyltransferase [Deltaproteobacteria bacterium]